MGKCSWVKEDRKQVVMVVLEENAMIGQSEMSLHWRRILILIQQS